MIRFQWEGIIIYREIKNWGGERGCYFRVVEAHTFYISFYIRFF